MLTLWKLSLWKMCIRGEKRCIFKSDDPFLLFIDCWNSLLFLNWTLTAGIRLLIYLKERSLLFTTVQGRFNSKPLIMNSLPTGPVEHVHLSVPFVAIRNKDVNITAVVWPSQAGTLTYFWWFGNSTKVQIPFGSFFLPKLFTTDGNSLSPNKNFLPLPFLCFSFFLVWKGLLLSELRPLWIYFLLSCVVLRSHYFLHLVVISPEIWRPLLLPAFTCNLTELCME